MIKRLQPLMGVLVFLILFPVTSFTNDTFVSKRMKMVKEIEQDVISTSLRIGKSQLAASAMNAVSSVPRHKFVPEELVSAAYENRPLPIGYGQTISQPYIVALMTDMLHVDSDDVVLEVGTGSGYQAAVLAEIVQQVYTIEIVPQLSKQAKERLKRLGYDNIEVHSGDGYYGLEKYAPFDAIVVTAAAGHIPPPLIKQLKPGARMVIPVGNPFYTQQLMIVEKAVSGKIHTRQLLPVIFVPLTGGH